MALKDVIKLLPDTVANQIAAGEVVQRPASVLKELLENSVDAGSTRIQVFIRNGGKTLVQVIDDGCGMSETDARMSFERHATSKIQSADDLFNLYTFGFRGEALASISAVAQVELKTKRKVDELATCIRIDGGNLIHHEPCAAPDGTCIIVKNLFYNVPARRNFLKSNTVELRHLMDEFVRVALSHPEIAFSFTNEDEEIYQLRPGTLRQRIVALWGKRYEERLVPLVEKTEILEVNGFLGTPELARKTRGEQFFFANGRYIRSPYLNFAISNAFEQLLPEDAFPFYVIFLKIPASRIDINVHPTKTEVKLEDEKSIFAILSSAAKLSLSQYHIAPALNFEQDQQFAQTTSSTQQADGERLRVNRFPVASNFGGQRVKTSDWEELYKVLSRETPEEKPATQQPEQLVEAGESKTKPVMQLHNKYILTSIRSGLMLIGQQPAHERILYEHYMDALSQNKAYSQQLLFPEVVELNVQEVELLKDLLPEVKALGFGLEVFGKNAFLIKGLPAELKDRDSKTLIEQLLENYSKGSSATAGKGEKLAKALARQAAIKAGTPLSAEEMHSMIDELFACQMPYYSPDGKPTIITISAEELDKKFGS